jgi:predicted NUDIX family NTP pyrophosphohydrolase
MKSHSAGILLFRRSEGGVEVMLVHPGGPFFAKKDAGSWTLPKGEYDPDTESALAAARREFAEETGAELQGELFADLGSIRQRSGKVVHAFAFEGDFDTSLLSSNEFEMEWPPHSGMRRAFPEIDRAGWFTGDEARKMVILAQVPLLERLLDAL